MVDVSMLKFGMRTFYLVTSLLAFFQKIEKREEKKFKEEKKELNSGTSIWI